MGITNEYLKKRIENLMLDKMPRNENIMDEIFNFNVYTLESTDAVKISQFVIGLSQFLIYFGSQVNNTKVSLMQKKKILELRIERSDIKSKTKADKRRKVIDDSPELQQIEVGIELEEQELSLIENREKYLLELINAFKRELTRRETEIKMVRTERRM